MTSRDDHILCSSLWNSSFLQEVNLFWGSGKLNEVGHQEVRSQPEANHIFSLAEDFARCCCFMKLQSECFPLCRAGRKWWLNRETADGNEGKKSKKTSSYTPWPPPRWRWWWWWQQQRVWMSNVTGPASPTHAWGGVRLTKKRKLCNKGIQLHININLPEESESSRHTSD